MAYGTKGELLEEKIQFLKDLGIKDLVVYYPHGGMTKEYVMSGCSNNTNKFLIWVAGSKNLYRSLMIAILTSLWLLKDLRFQPSI